MPATPIRLGDGSPTLNEDDPALDEGGQDDGKKPTLDDKILSDAIAYIRSLAELRGRNADWAERAVRQAASLPAGEALKLGVIDLVAADLPQLLAKLDGMQIKQGDETLTLDLADREIIEFEPSLHTRFLAVITDPTIAYGLLMIGMIGLLVEVAIPGLFLPGVIGLVSLLLALYAFQLLPVSLVGLGIIVLGVILMIVELTLVGFGLIGVSGIVAFVLGSIFLIDTGVPGYGISKSMVGLIAVISSSLLMMFLVWIRRLHSMPVLGGAEELVGGMATVKIWQGDTGRVSMRGTTWAARSSGALAPGQRVRVDRRRRIDRRCRARERGSDIMNDYSVGLVIVLVIVAILLAILAAASVVIIKEFERGVVLTLGRYSGMRRPGLRFVIPVLQRMEKVDTREKVVDIQPQEIITKDNVLVRVNGVVYYRVHDPALAILDTEDYNASTREMAQATLAARRSAPTSWTSFPIPNA